MRQRSGFIKGQIKTLAIGHVKRRRKKNWEKTVANQAFSGACTREISALYCALLFFSLIPVRFSLEEKNARSPPASL